VYNIANPDPLSGNVNSKLLQEPISHCHTCSQIHPKIQYTTLPRRFQQCLCIVSGLFVLPFNDITVSLTASAVPQFRSTQYPQYAVRCDAVRGERTPVLRSKLDYAAQLFALKAALS